MKHIHNILLKKCQLRLVTNVSVLFSYFWNRTWMFCFTSAVCTHSAFWTACTALRGLNGQRIFCVVVGGRCSRCRRGEAFNGLQQSRPETSDSKIHFFSQGNNKFIKILLYLHLLHRDLILVFQVMVVE